MQEKIIRHEINKIEHLLQKYADEGVIGSWGCSEIRCYPDVPFMGNCWSAQVNGMVYQGRIFVSLGNKPNTLSVAKEDAFGRILHKDEFDDHIRQNLPVKEAIDQLDKWIEVGDLSEDEYLKKAGETGRRDLENLYAEIQKMFGGTD